MDDNRKSLFHRIFGPSQDEIWFQLSQEIGAYYEKRSFFQPAKVVLPYHNWNITLDTVTIHSDKVVVTYTRMHARFVNRKGIRFTINVKNVFHCIGEMIGRNYIKISDSFFDNSVAIKGSPENEIKLLLQNNVIRTLILNQKNIHLTIRTRPAWLEKRFAEGENELYFRTVGIIKDKERLKELFQLFSHLLDELAY